MGIENADSTEPDGLLLDEVVTAYLKALEAGERPDPDEWVKRYPMLAGQLEVFFADQEEMARLAVPLQAAACAARNQLIEPVASFGDYEVFEEIGRGGMGVVYKARQRSLNRLVALKLLLPGRATAETRRFRQEAEMAAGLDH